MSGGKETAAGSLDIGPVSVGRLEAISAQVRLAAKKRDAKSGAAESES